MMRRANGERLYYALEFLLAMPTWVVAAVYLVRVLSLYLVGCYRREWFDTFHLAIWQTIVFAVAILFFANWTRGKAPVDAAQRA